ncbi:MAG: DUF2325 domain-containing protein [Deltaproteobacteria bacterium]|nr:DUF2325 domain-containing protein [Deltaproteobacteria bacterium]
MSAPKLRVLVVGGLTRLDGEYTRDLPPGLEVEAVLEDCASLAGRASAADALVLVVGNVSHSAAAKVRRVARLRGTPLASVPSASASRIREAVASLGSRLQLAG